MHKNRRTILDHRGPVMVDMLLGNGHDPQPVQIVKKDVIDMLDNLAGGYDAIYLSFSEGTNILYINPEV